ncbi:SDR family oxidoreductase [Kitasatospora sp. CM 4170]|uniref:SDR family oxidoreductase n=1 Tax=Kitasatospora aburaviensis TaxID=67265 RepID=A0ABW1EQX3_9ACTN|nr:SDR family oxidoreductase [Kitasatospora sp. CM 4170]WNM44397.1 SDR family oxidoreductase [Kitasatospora sp. CM 4170]
MTEWEHRTALIAGGTRGVGLAVARELAGRGCHVYLNHARDDAAAKDALAALADLPGRATVLKGDVTRPDALPRLLRRVREERGRLDAFVHSAASFHPMDAARPDAELFRQDVTTALAPLLLGVRPLVGAMAGGPGRIVAVSSNGARRVVPRYLAAGVAKAALEAQIRYLAVELAPLGITVNAVAAAKLDKGPGGADAGVLRVLAERTPGGRLTTPADLARTVALLCADEASWIHGQVVTADGGLSLRA